MTIWRSTSIEGYDRLTMRILDVFVLDLGQVGLQLGLGAALLFGLPLLIIGLAVRGLARSDRQRLLGALTYRRRIAELGAPGPVTVSGRVRREGGLALQEDAASRALIEVPPEMALAEGELVTLHGDVRSAGHAGGYRDDARAFVIDARGDDHLVLRTSIDVALRRAQVQILGGGFFVAVSLFILCCGAAGDFVSTFTVQSEIETVLSR